MIQFDDCREVGWNHHRVMISKKSFTTKKKRFYSWMIPPFVDIFPIGKGGFPASYVSLPEGMFPRSLEGCMVPWKGVWCPGGVYGSPPSSRPQVLVRLDTLPRNSNGKIDRAKLLWCKQGYMPFEYAVMMVYEQVIYIYIYIYWYGDIWWLYFHNTMNMMNRVI